MGGFVVGIRPQSSREVGHAFGEPAFVDQFASDEKVGLAVGFFCFCVGLLGPCVCLSFPPGHEGAKGYSCDGHQKDHGDGGDHESVATNEFAKEITFARRAGGDGFVVEIALEIGSEFRDGAVAPFTVFLERLEDDPVEFVLNF